MRATGPAQERRRWLGLGALALMASALIPVAIAMACNPQAYLTLDRSQYAPGDSVRVSGSFFRENAQVTVSVTPGGQSATVTTTGNGAFQTTFALPANAASGGYSVQAIGYEPNGDVVAGLPARASFSVAAAQAAPQTSTPSAGGQTSGGSQASQPATAPQAGQPAAPQATRPAQRPAAGTPSSSFREPSVFGEPNVLRSGAAPRATGRGSATARADQPATERATANGRAVFGGSVAPVVSASNLAPAAAATPAAQGSQSRAVRPRASSEPASVSRRAAAQTAADDVWSAVGAGRSPSVLPVAGDGVAVSSPRAGSQLALGLVLLGSGLLALIGGLAAGEARRRRVRAR